MKKIYYIIILLLLPSCNHFPVITDQEFASLINKGKSNLNTKIRFNSYFNDFKKTAEYRDAELNDTIHARNIESFLDSTIIPIFLFNNGFILSTWGGITEEYINSSFVGKNDLYLGKGWFQWGTYEIKKDSIEAIINIRYRGRIPFWYNALTRYKGKIENDSTIVDWQPVKPFPSNNFDFVDTTKRVLKFRASSIADSIQPEKAWISKYLKK